MKKKQILAIVLVAVIIFGIILYLLLTRDSKYKLFKEIVLEESSITHEELIFSANGIKPGDSRDYTLQLTAKDNGFYGIDFSFVENNDGGLRNFIVVRLEHEDDIREYSLDELFNGLTIGFNIEVFRKTPTLINVIFIMPQEIGNEAQGAECYFIVNLTAERI